MPTKPITTHRLGETMMSDVIREMLAAIPGGNTCDPQHIADDLRAIARSHGIETEDSMPTKPITSHKLDKSGKLVAKPARLSVSAKIQQRKSKKRTVVSQFEN